MSSCRCNQESNAIILPPAGKGKKVEHGARRSVLTSQSASLERGRPDGLWIIIEQLVMLETSNIQFKEMVRPLVEMEQTRLEADLHKDQDTRPRPRPDQCSYTLLVPDYQ